MVEGVSGQAQRNAMRTRGKQTVTIESMYARNHSALLSSLRCLTWPTLCLQSGRHSRLPHLTTVHQMAIAPRPKVTRLYRLHQSLYKLNQAHSVFRTSLGPPLHLDPGNKARFPACNDGLGGGHLAVGSAHEGSLMAGQERQGTVVVWGDGKRCSPVGNGHLRGS